MLLFLSPHNMNNETDSNNHTEDRLANVIFYLTICIIITGTIGNTLVIGSVLVHKRLRVLYNTFIVNLAVSDMLVTTVVSASSIASLWTDGDSLTSKPVLCEFLGSVCITSCISSVLNIAAISINRYVKICWNATYHKIFNRRTVPVMVVLFWVVCFLIDFPNIIGWGNHAFSTKFMLCTYVQSNATYSYSMFFFIVGFMGPWTVSGIAYLKIFLFTRKANRNLQRSATRGGTMGKPPRLVKSQTVLHMGINEMRIVRSTFTIWLVFIIMWSPYAIIIMFDRDYAWSHEIYATALLLAHGNSSINSILYAVTNQHFREGYWHLLKCRFLKSNRIVDSEHSASAAGRKRRNRSRAAISTVSSVTIMRTHHGMDYNSHAGFPGVNT